MFFKEKTFHSVFLGSIHIFLGVFVLIHECSQWKVLLIWVSQTWREQHSNTTGSQSVRMIEQMFSLWKEKIRLYILANFLTFFDLNHGWDYCLLPEAACRSHSESNSSILASRIIILYTIKLIITCTQHCMSKCGTKVLKWTTGESWGISNISGSLLLHRELIYCTYGNSCACVMCAHVLVGWKKTCWVSSFSCMRGCRHFYHPTPTSYIPVWVITSKPAGLVSPVTVLQRAHSISGWCRSHVRCNGRKEKFVCSLFFPFLLVSITGFTSHEVSVECVCVSM